MARSRLELQDLLEEILGSDHVYFQPPETIQMEYPCIVYRLEDVDKRHADNIPYMIDKQYQLIVIDWNPDSEIPDRLLQIPYSRSGTHYTASNLHHWTAIVYW